MHQLIEMAKPKMKKLFTTGFFHIFGSSVINKIIGFLSSVILVRFLSKAEYGIFTSAWNIYSIVLIFNGVGMVNAIMQMCSENSGDSDSVKSVFKYCAKYGLVADAILAVAMAFIALFIPLSIEGAAELLLLLCLLPIIQFGYDAIQAYLRSVRNNQMYSRLSILNTALYAVLSVVGALFFKEKGLVYGHYLASSITVLYGLYVIKARDIVLYKSSLNKSEKQSTINIAFVSMMNNGISQLLYLLDIFVLGIVAADETILAGYKVATTIPTALIFIPMGLVTYIYPYFAQHKDDGNWCIKQYKRVVLASGALNFVISLGLFTFANPIIYIVFGETYLDIVPIFRLLVINYFISGTFRIVSGNLLVTQRCLKFNTFVACVSGLVNAVCDYFFITWWGAVGAACATIAVVVVSSILSTSYLIKQFQKKKIRG